MVDVDGCIVVDGFGLDVEDETESSFEASIDDGASGLFCTLLFLTRIILGAAKISEKERGAGVTL